jgi:hypothetical protein
MGMGMGWHSMCASTAWTWAGISCGYAVTIKVPCGRCGRCGICYTAAQLLPALHLIQAATGAVGLPAAMLQVVDKGHASSRWPQAGARDLATQCRCQMPSSVHKASMPCIVPCSSSTAQQGRLWVASLLSQRGHCNRPLRSKWCIDACLHIRLMLMPASRPSASPTSASMHWCSMHVQGPAHLLIMPCRSAYSCLLM